MIIGRDAGLARLRGLVDPAPSASRVLLVTGEAGMGKTVLLADAAEQARAAGRRVLWVAGRESESRLAFAGLHQLLRPVLPAVAGSPGPQAQALLGALGLSDPAAADRRLGARSSAQRAQAELRASGVTVAGAVGEPGALGELTPQQRQIVRLAGDGLTDREIADRLFLSPRTVSSHLYRSYPRLGVASRRQLRDVIGPAPPTPGAVAAAGRCGSAGHLGPGG